jgi:hypothetical protein
MCQEFVMTTIRTRQTTARWRNHLARIDGSTQFIVRYKQSWGRRVVQKKGRRRKEQREEETTTIAPVSSSGRVRFALKHTPRLLGFLRFWALAHGPVSLGWLV